MAIEVAMDSIETPHERLRRSRAEIVALAKELKRDTPQGSLAFPRSAIMRAATGRTGRTLLAGAALSLALLRPGLLAAVGRSPLAALLLRSVVNRYLVRRFIR
jgi:hypothetical protein